ncbi:hypothetical protein E4H12_01890 [Candidatus Thorarchaeota archaeon]|nr:MAG: hypothetical protein E4H12_01890 [Candidatus Thorarchaeota archaeon]
MNSLFVLMVVLNLNAPELDPHRVPYFKQEYFRVIETKFFGDSMECQKVAQQVSARAGVVFNSEKPRETVLGGYCAINPTRWGVR